MRAKNIELSQPCTWGFVLGVLIQKRVICERPFVLYVNDPLLTHLARKLKVAW
jgi:hypothetical protein